MPLLIRIAPVALVLAAWELVSRAALVNPHVFPPVSEIALRWVALFVDGRIYLPLWETVWRALAGFVVWGAIVVAPGLHVGASGAVKWFFEPLFSFGFPLPKIALIPLYVHW